MLKRPNTAAAGLGGAVSVVLIYAATALGWSPPPEVAAALTTIVSAFFVEARNVANGNGVHGKPESE